MESGSLWKSRGSVNTGDIRMCESENKNKRRSLSLWRPRSVTSLFGSASGLDSSLTFRATGFSRSSSALNITAAENSQNDDNKKQKTEISKTDKGTKVIIVLVNAKGLPSPPDDGYHHSIYCKFRLGTESFKSKAVPYKRQPEWCERFSLRLSRNYLLKISVCDKGKQKNILGRTVLDLSLLEKERTQEIWQQLDGDFGSLHLTATLCSKQKDSTFSNDNDVTKLEKVNEKYVWYNLKSQWDSVGQLNVKLIKAKGLNSRISAFCTLELDNERVQTHSTSTSSEPTWNKCYVFNVHDVTSTLDLKLYDNSLLNPLRSESLGRVSIPLLRIINGEQHWFALKDKSKRHIAKGNCPRVLLEMTVVWNPVKASIRLFQPKEVKYVKKSQKFDIALVYSNVKFIRDTFNVLYELNENYKSLFEWKDQELSLLAVVCWCVFCHYLRLWTVPLFILLPFFYYWCCRRNNQDTFTLYQQFGEEQTDSSQDNNNNGANGITGKIKGIQEMTLTITDGIEYIASLVERIYNLLSFKVPFLSYLVMLLLIIASFGLYVIPFNYILMLLGVYKYTRKYLNPGRVLNNDLLDFISRIPDNRILKDWKELSVPEPQQSRF